MNKQEVQQRVLKNGKPLDLSLFEWNENAKTFSTTEDSLVIDFNEGYDCTFDTVDGCTFKTGAGCTFKTGENSVVVRRDTYEIIEIPVGKTIKLNNFKINGYSVIECAKEQGKRVKIKLAYGQILEGILVEE